MPPEILVPVFKKELEEWVAIGVTTLSTRLSGNEVSCIRSIGSRGRVAASAGLLTRDRPRESFPGKGPETFRKSTGAMEPTGCG